MGKAVDQGKLTGAIKALSPVDKKGPWHVLCDNEHFLSSAASKKAHRRASVALWHIPARSPDLNPCDFALWKEINKRMKQQELKWKSTRRETRDEYLGRWRRIATRLPKSFIEDSIANMARRCKRLHEAKGGHFEEGGSRN